MITSALLNSGSSDSEEAAVVSTSPATLKDYSLGSSFGERPNASVSVTQTQRYILLLLYQL